MNRERRSKLAQETLEILERGDYTSPSGREVSIAEMLSLSETQSRLYRPEDFPEVLHRSERAKLLSLEISVTPETTLEALSRFAMSGIDSNLFCLNFASAKNPGGGFLSGSQAQEESLARSSGLYRCQMSHFEMYEFNRRHGTSLYSDYMLYSPNVPVFRDDSGQLLEEPYPVSFLTTPAVNAGAIKKNEAQNIPLIVPTLRERMRKMLWVASSQGHRTLVLGAWGCGVFDNDPETVAGLFAELLLPGGEFSQEFDRAVFAVYDRSEGQEVLSAFRRQLELQ